MFDSVKTKVLRQCRNALLGGTPIIYIKTDSDVFIQNLLLDENSPLIVLLSNGGRKGTEEERDLKRMRPIYELTNEQEKKLQFCINYRNSYPELDGSGIYRELYESPKDMANEKMIGPFIWVYKMPDDVAEHKKVFTNLENFVACHEDPKHVQYNILKNSVVVLYSSKVSISSMLQSYTEFVDVDYPDEEEIRTIIKSASMGDPNLIENEEYLSVLCSDFLGFTVEEVELTMRKIMSISSLDNSEEVERIISNHKKQKMQGGILEQCSSSSNIGGMDAFRQWLSQQVEPLKNSNLYMRKIGTPPPKGVLLCGIPGCGKSEAAKFTAKTLGLPLLKMDIGSLMDKYQGVSEQKMRDALNMAEAMSPCVLWIDELEKGFSGAGDSGDSSSFKRMFGYMLGWMQDNKKPCFIFATANDIGGLPKEFFRSGRFDALYAVYLPTAEECISIFQACMNKAVDNIAKTKHIEKNTIALFAEECYSEKLFIRIIDDFLINKVGRPRIVVGSDIQKIVNLALRELSEEKIITGQLWENALRKVVTAPFLNTYGDGEENIDSIAVAYCRMLRKGFIPTSSNVLFDQQDYHMENVEEYDRLKKVLTASMNSEEMQKHKERLAQYEILQDRCKNFKYKYDAAVYSYLKTRINEVAPVLEKHEREVIIMR